jgi:hypothetical protein
MYLLRHLGDQSELSLKILFHPRILLITNKLWRNRRNRWREIGAIKGVPIISWTQQRPSLLNCVQAIKKTSH